MSNLLTVHQNLPALPVDATSDEVRKNLMDMFRDRQAFSEHTWKMLLSVCRSWAAWCKLNASPSNPGASNGSGAPITSYNVCYTNGITSLYKKVGLYICKAQAGDKRW
ncbi:hypothetical protein SOL51_10270, partial [Lactobacillus helveticus]|uniref:hypothetical protein n=1 Tax=Lactobacillus helveticus TaxID=1587 RepID=UPI002A6AB969